MLGTIKAVKLDKGFGFIESKGEPDVFFHIKQLQGLPFDEQLIGRRVEFSIEKTTKGPRATAVRPAE